MCVVRQGLKPLCNRRSVATSRVRHVFIDQLRFLGDECGSAGQPGSATHRKPKRKEQRAKKMCRPCSGSELLFCLICRSLVCACISSALCARAGNSLWVDRAEGVDDDLKRDGTEKVEAVARVSETSPVPAKRNFPRSQLALHIRSASPLVHSTPLSQKSLPMDAAVAADSRAPVCLCISVCVLNTPFP